MTTPGASGAFCPFCGAPVTIAGARFCATCGRDMTGAAAPPSPSAAIPVSPAPPYPASAAAPGYPTSGYPASAAPAYPVPAATLTAAPPMAAPPMGMPAPAKSQGVALLLEFLIPGGGLLYLGRIGLGVAWLVGSFVAGLLIGIISSISASMAVASCANQIYSTGDACAPNTGGIQALTVIAFIVGLGWLIFRLVYISRNMSRLAQPAIRASVVSAPGYGQPVSPQGAPSYASAAYPAGYAPGYAPGQAAAGAPPATVNTARMVGVAAGLAIIAGVISHLFLTVNPFSPTVELFVAGIYAATAYAYALLRLPQATWLRVVLEAGALLLVAFTLNELAYGLQYGVPPFFQLMRAFTDSGIMYALIAMIVGALLGCGAALISAPWSGLRAQRPASGGQRYLIQAALVIVGFLVVFQAAIFMWDYGIIQIMRLFSTRFDPYNNPAPLSASIGNGIFQWAPLIAILAVALIQALRLQRQAASAV